MILGLTLRTTIGSFSFWFYTDLSHCSLDCSYCHQRLLLRKLRFDCARYGVGCQYSALLEQRQYCFEIGNGYSRYVPFFKRQSSNVALWINVIMTCTQQRGLPVYLFVSCPYTTLTSDVSCPYTTLTYDVCECKESKRW